jgi:AcrR family transcriptional regulator
MSTSGRRKHAYHHGNLANEALRRAGELLEEQGVAGVTLRELARRTKVSHSAPYRHFRDRASLLAALAAEGFARLAQAQREARTGGGRWAMGEAYVRFALDNPQRFRLMFGGELGIEAHPGLRTEAASAYEGLVRSFAGMGDARAAEVAAAAAWSLTHGLASLLLDGHFRRATQDGRETQGFVRAVLGAIRVTLGAQRSA